jgi:hypothetical protein
MKFSTIGTELLRRMGFIGSGDPVSSIIPRANTPSANQELVDDFMDASRVANPDTWMKYATIMKRPSSMDQVLDLWEEMGTWDLMAAALTELVEEATQRDPINPGTLWFECNDAQFEDDLNEMLDLIGVEDILNSQVWYLAALGNHYEKIEYAQGEGVLGLHFIHPKLVRRYWLEKNRQCIGFKWSDRKPRASDIFVAADGVTEIPRAAIASSQGRAEDLWYPWDILHMRRMFRMRSSEYGEAIYDEAQGIYKKLRMAVDQMVVHRAQVQPDRYVINIDVQEQAPADQMRTVQRWKQMLRSKQSFGAGATDNLAAPTDFKSFYNPWALDSVLWVAMPKGFQHTISKLAGTANVPDVYDIELLTDLFYSILGMPKSWFGIGESGGQNAPSGKSLLAQDIRFLRKVRSIRKPILSQYTWLGNFHAILKGKTNLDSLNIQAKMADIGGLEDQMKLDLLSTQADILGKLADVMAAYNLPKEAWIELIFKRYLRLPDNVVNFFMTALPAPVEAPAFESKGKADDLKRIFETIRSRLDPEKTQIMMKIKAAVESSSIDNHVKKKYRGVPDVLSLPQIRAGDSIIVGDSARMVAGNDFKVDKSALTGPMRTLNENQQKPVVQKLVINESTEPKPKTEEKSQGPAPVFESNETDNTAWRKYTRLHK